MQTLEREFSDFKLAHIVAVLKVMLIRYYEVVLANTVQLPVWMGGETPESCADRDIAELYNRDKEQFFNTYEKAYQILAQEGEF